MFLNVSLTVYYLLVISFGMREQRLKKLRLLLFGPPLLIGFGLAFAVFPFVTQAFVGCQVKADIYSSHIWQLLVFVLIPVLGSTAAILIMLAMLYWKVRSQRRRTRRKWAFVQRNGQGRSANFSNSNSSQTVMNSSRPRREKSAGSKDDLEREVFFQCISYALSFGITWPLLAVAQVKASDFDLPYAFYVSVVIVTPLQGFNNALCYFRPLSKRLKQRRRRLMSTHREEATTSKGFVKAQLDKLRSALCSRPFASRENAAALSSASVEDIEEIEEEDPAVKLSNLKSEPEFASFDDANNISIDTVDHVAQFEGTDKKREDAEASFSGKFG